MTPVAPTSVPPAVRQPRGRAAIGVDLFTGAVVVSVALALAGLTWRLAGESGVAAPAVVAAPVAPPAPVDVAAIVAASPFGAAAPTTATAGGLTLRAILFARPASASTALVSAGDAPSVLLHIGDPAPGGAIVDSIAVDHIVLRAASGLQTLAFPKPGAAPPTEGTGSAPAAQPFVGLPTPTAPVPIPSAPLVFSPPPGGAGAPAAFLDSLGATATDGGYRIGPSASPAMRSAGLQPGDLVERVNGSAVGDATRDRALFASAAAGGALRVELVRNGRRIAVSLPAR